MKYCDWKSMLRLFALFGILWSSILSGGTTGKIAGLVKDKSSGEPLPGANILVEGTTLRGIYGC